MIAEKKAAPAADMPLSTMSAALQEGFRGGKGLSASEEGDERFLKKRSLMKEEDDDDDDDDELFASVEEELSVELLTGIEMGGEG